MWMVTADFWRTRSPSRLAWSGVGGHTAVDAQCDKLATVVGRTKLTTLATFDVPWRECRKVATFRVWEEKCHEGSAIFEDIRISFQHIRKAESSL